MRRFVAKGTVAKVLRNPRLWPSAVRAMITMAPAKWWRRAPFLPLPDKEYWHFRLETIHGGDGTTPPSSDEVIDVIVWLRALRALRR